MTHQYKDPAGGTPSTVGNQMNTFYYQRKALIEAKKEQYFQPLANTTAMPKHFGKKIKRYHYLPLLDDANLNDQGIDATGVAIDPTKFTIIFSKAVYTFPVEANATAAAAAANAVEAGFAVKTGSATPWTVTLDSVRLPNATAAQVTTVNAAFTGGVSSIQNSGNLYGSSKDVGTITGKLPVLSETGGRVNRVGFRRKEIEGSFEKFGFFHEYTQEALDFDSDNELMMHLNREVVMGANEITEDLLQVDLLTQAGVVKYAGTAVDDSTVDSTCVVTYADLLRLSIDLDNNRCPKQTKMVTGSRYTDTMTIPGARLMYVGSELQPLFEGMVDLHSNPAFIPVQKYGAATQPVKGEIGTVGYFRIVVVPEMMKWEGAGAAVGANTTHYSNGANFDVFPMLVIGDESFTTIGFETDGKSMKFKTIHKKPGEATADRNEPYGELGFMSIKWWYGFMLLRGERLAVLKTAAPM